MSQILPRGYEVARDQKITKILSEGTGWQIYRTNLDCYALAVQDDLYDIWVAQYSLPSGLFRPAVQIAAHIFVSSGEYIISSLESGPFPENNVQIEAFSIAFNTAVSLFKNINLHDAVYIEEYSLILPTLFSEEAEDIGIAYGKWITGGVSLSIRSINRVSKIMSWLPKASLEHAARLAGFEGLEIGDTDTEQTIDSPNDPDNCEQVDIPSIKPTGAFSLVGRPELESFLNENIVDIVLNQEAYKKMGISFPGATILHGPPGCGKTFAVEKLSEYLGWKRFDIDSGTIGSSYIHDTSKKISEVFNSAIKAAPSILVIDEMEAFLTDRGTAGPSGTHHIEEVAEFLRRIPEAIAKGVLVFAMTNMIDKIDPAILRRGRFDYIVEVKMAKAEEIEALLKAKIAELPVDETVDTALIAHELDEHPLSDVAFVLREAGKAAVKNNLQYMNQECFEAAIKLLPKKEQQRKIGFGAE